MAPHGVDFIDEHDAGRVFLGLLEHIAHAAGADAHEHFHKIRPRDGKEGHARLACNGAGQQGFTGARGANKQRTFGDFTAQAAKFLRVAQEFNDLLQLVLGLVDAGHILERHAAMFFCQQLGPRFAKAHRATAATALHAVHEINPDPDQQHKGQERQNKGLKAALLLAFGGDWNVLIQQQFGDCGILWLDRHIVFAILATKAHTLAIQGDAADFLGLNALHKIGIADAGALHGRARSAEQIEKRKDQQEQDHPKGDVSRVAQGNSPNNLVPGT